MEALLFAAALLAVFAAPALAEKPSIMFILAVSLRHRRHNPTWGFHAVFFCARRKAARWRSLTDRRPVGRRMTSGTTRWDS